MKNTKPFIWGVFAILIIAVLWFIVSFARDNFYLDAKIGFGLKDSDPLVRQAWTMIKQDVEHNEYVSSELFMYRGTVFTEAEITKLELADSFDQFYEDAVIEVYELNYRMKPKDPSKIMLAGGMTIKDGWLLERGSMGSPYLVFKNSGSERTFMGTIYPVEAGTYIGTRDLLYRLGALKPVMFTDYPSGAAFVRSVANERGKVEITEEIRKSFNLFARDYRWIYLPDMDGYESFFEMTNYGDTYSYTNFAGGVFYMLSYMKYPEVMGADAMEEAIQSLFAAKGSYGPMPHQAYPKMARYEGGYYSPAPEGGLNHDRMFYLLTAMEITEKEDDAVYIKVRAQSYYFHDPGYEPGKNELWIAEKAKELDMDEMEAAAKLIAGGNMEGIEAGFEYETMIRAGGTRGLNPQFLSNRRMDLRK